MRDTVYLLDISPLREMQGEQDYIQQALGKLDECRRKKAESIKKEHAKAASIGAGLLLQWAAQAYMRTASADLRGAFQAGEEAAWQPKKTKCAEAAGALEKVTVETLLEQLGEPLSLIYRYGKSGKPYWEEIPLYFSLSHSGKYVLCAV